MAAHLPATSVEYECGHLHRLMRFARQTHTTASGRAVVFKHTLCDVQYPKEPAKYVRTQVYKL